MGRSPGLFDGAIITQLCDGSSGDPQLEKQYANVILEAFSLWKERHKKYGRGNIGRYGSVGCLVRLGDKTSRLEEAYLHGKSDFPDETIVDSWLDAINYPIMGLICHRGGWPREPHEQPARPGFPVQSNNHQASGT